MNTKNLFILHVTCFITKKGTTVKTRSWLTMKGTTFKQDFGFWVFPSTVLYLVKVEKNQQIWIHFVGKIHLYD